MTNPARFFLPNDSRKYSVGENAGMKLDARGGIDLIMRIYAPDLERYGTWSPPKAERTN